MARQGKLEAARPPRMPPAPATPMTSATPLTSLPPPPSPAGRGRAPPRRVAPIAGGPAGRGAAGAAQGARVAGDARVALSVAAHSNGRHEDACMPSPQGRAPSGPSPLPSGRRQGRAHGIWRAGRCEPTDRLRGCRAATSGSTRQLRGTLRRAFAAYCWPDVVRVCVCALARASERSVLADPGSQEGHAHKDANGSACKLACARNTMK